MKRVQQSLEDEVSLPPEVFEAVKPPLIAGVKTRTLKPIVDERGYLMEIFRADWPEFVKFGQVYMTTAYPGVVKAWHYHRRQVDHFACLKGALKVVLYDPRRSSTTHGAVNEFFLGERNHILLEIPPLIYHGFKCISEEEAILLNVTNEPYIYDHPDEYRLPPHTKKIPYSWERKDG